MNNEFYNNVSGWIRSYYRPEALENLRTFINNAQQPDGIKMKLHREINDKINALKKTPRFGDIGGYLLDDIGQTEVFTTRMAAHMKMVDLGFKGYKVQLCAGQYFYRIKLIKEAPVQDPVFGY